MLDGWWIMWNYLCKKEMVLESRETTDYKITMRNFVRKLSRVENKRNAMHKRAIFAMGACRSAARVHCSAKIGA